MTLVLGTATFGWPYGINNRVGKMTQRQVTEMVRTAWDWGINEFDTAQMYQDSEAFLGNAFEELGVRESVKVVTKLHPDLDYSDEDVVVNSVRESLGKLKIDKLYGVLLHREHLLDDEQAMKSLLAVWLEGLTEKLGASVYLDRYARDALNNDIIDIVQGPSCVLDRRFERAGVLDLAREKEKEVYVRSIFLQGLLLNDEGHCPIAKVRPYLEELGKLCQEVKLSRAEFCMGYIRKTMPKVKMIFGAETPEQVRECAASYWYPFPRKMIGRVREAFPDVPIDVLSPNMWRKE